MLDPVREPIVDAHMHLWDRVEGRVEGRTPVRPAGQGCITIGEKRVLGMPAYLVDCRAPAETFIAEMDAAGVAAGVVVQEYLDGEQNDYLLEVAERYPDRLFVHGLPDWFQPGAVAAEVAGLLERGFRGIKMPAMHLVNDVALDDPRLIPAYRAIRDADAVLAIDLSAGEGQVPAFRRVLDRCPGLKVSIGHFGMPNRGGWPGQLALCRDEHVYLETGGIVWLYREEGTRFGSAMDAIHQAIDTIGAHKIMWGSDWPRTMVDFTYRQSLAFLLDDPALSDIDRELICGANAQRLYGLRLAYERGAGPLPRITERRTIRRIRQDAPAR